MTPEIVINGKFYSAPLEGMPRVGREITAALDRLMTPDASPLTISLCVPHATTGFEGLANIKIAPTGTRTGFLWEQIDLPRFAGSRTILNFTATGPIMARNAITVVHDAQQYSTPRSFHWKNKLLYRTVTPAICRTHARIVTVSSYAKEEIVSYNLCRADKIDVIHNGADHMLRCHRDETVFDRIGLTRGEYILCNSYSHEHKNVRVIFAALSDHPEIARRLVLFGASTREDHEACNVQVPEGVRFVGRIGDGALRSLYEHAAMFLFPSKTEGFGLPPLEAMILGCPVVVSQAGAMPEVCGDAALYADPRETRDWLDAIQALLADPVLQRTRARAGVQRAAMFTWDQPPPATFRSLPSW